MLILGGSSEASALARAVAGREGIDAVLSLAGRTATPLDGPLRSRTGGFGGVDGLAAYLRSERIDAVVDATHPFAERMTRHARAATARTGAALIRLTRPAWEPSAGDRWEEVADMGEAAQAIGPEPRRAFLTIGRLHLRAFATAAHHRYLVRSIDPLEADHGLRDARFVVARGPFTLEGEARLLRDHRVDVLVTKNSGGAASQAKLFAARQLGLPVILVRRPCEPGPVMDSVAEVVAALEAHREVVPRGV